MKFTFKTLFNKQSIILTLSILLIISNTFFLGVNTISRYTKNVIPFEPGFQFFHIKEKLGQLKQIGYLTNKDMTREHNDGIYLQAQYFLAPTILDLNNSKYRLLIMDYPNKTFLVYMLRKLRYVPMSENGYGQVLVVKRLR